MNTDEWSAWFVGFTDGEGCFYAGKNSSSNRNIEVCLSFRLHLRELPVLEEMQRRLQCGRVSVTGHVAQYRIRNMDDLVAVIIPLFDRFPLMSTKRNDYAIWRALVLRLQAVKHHKLYTPNVSGLEQVARLRVQRNLQTYGIESGEGSG